MESTPVKSRTFVLVACEASGDLLGEGLVRSLRARFPGCRVEGIGGEQMRSAGMTLWQSYDVLAVMGIAEVLKHLPRLLRLRRELAERIIDLRPDAFIGIDGPDFNLGLERRLKRAGIPTIHYVSPSVWAWREGRAKKIRASADRVLCLFPMEPPIYERYGMASTFVGHPLAADFEMEPDAAKARMSLGIPPDGTWLGVLPGSRVGEIERLGRVFLQATLLLRRQHPELRVLIPMANERARNSFEKILAELHLPREDEDFQAAPAEWNALRERIVVVDGRSHEVMKASDALLLASGTAALEGMLAKRPMVVAYKIAPLTHFIVKGLGILKINRYSLPNVLAGEPIVPELMQDDCTPERITDALTPLIAHPAARDVQVRRFRELHEQLLGSGSDGAAAAISEVATA